MTDKQKKLGIIHVAPFVAQTVQKYIEEIIPEVEVYQIADDLLHKDNVKAGVGVIPKNNYFKFATYARFLQEAGVDLILLSCSTFNSAVEVTSPIIDVPMLQIDRPMMDLAVNQGSRIGLLATLTTTVPSSEKLLLKAAKEAGKEIQIETSLCTEAFEVLRKGNAEKHNNILLDEIDKLSEKVDAIVMAQVSMSVLEPYLQNTSVPVYNSARSGFNKAKELLYGKYT